LNSETFYRLGRSFSMSMERTMNKLSPSIGPVKWRHGVEARFQFNAARCRKEAQGLTDPEEKAYTLNLAELWEQLAEAARFRQELGVTRAPSAKQQR
jgi:hypothetical protein